MRFDDYTGPSGPGNCDPYIGDEDDVTPETREEWAERAARDRAWYAQQRDDLIVAEGLQRLAAAGVLHAARLEAIDPEDETARIVTPSDAELLDEHRARSSR